MNLEFYQNILRALHESSDALEKVALDQASTCLWRIHTQLQDTIKSINFYYKEEFPNEQHEPM